MTSSAAAEWLIAKFPIDHPRWATALLLIPHRTWSKPEQLQLANYYLAKAPYASARGYEAIGAIMPFSRMIRVLKKYVPASDPDRDLFNYYVIPVLKKIASTEKDWETAMAFSEDLRVKASNNSLQVDGPFGPAA